MRAAKPSGLWKEKALRSVTISLFRFSERALRDHGCRCRRKTWLGAKLGKAGETGRRPFAEI